MLDSLARIRFGLEVERLIFIRLTNYTHPFTPCPVQLSISDSSAETARQQVAPQRMERAKRRRSRSAGPHDVALPQHRYNGGAKAYRGGTREDGSKSGNRSSTGREIDRCYASLSGQSQKYLVRDRVENGLQLAGIGGKHSFTGDLSLIVRRSCRIVGNVL
jgi:hypothetical protein